MYIAILGAGPIGGYVASLLSKEGHNVVLLDRDLKQLEQIARECDIATLYTSGAPWNALTELLPYHPDLFIAAAEEDETNLAACAVAKRLGFPKTVACVQSEELLSSPNINVRELFQIDHFVGADLWAAQDLFKVLIHSGDIAIEHFAHGTVQMRTLRIPEQWDREAISIRDLELPVDLLIGLIRRKLPDGSEVTLFPGGEDRILRGDAVTLVGKTKTMQHLHELFHTPNTPIRSVVLAGGSTVAFYLARLLIQQKISVRIIDSDLQRCEELAKRLPQATIIHRDASDAALLLAEGVAEADALVSCTKRDSDNLLIAALARQVGCPRAIAAVTDPMVIPMLEKLGITPALAARVNLSHRILSILHEATILSVSPLSDEQAKVVELKVAPSSPLIGTPLASLALPKNLLIAAIETKSGEVTIGRGHSMLASEDTAVAICSLQQLSHLQELFQ